MQLLSGLANAMFLFLIASGLTLIFGVTRIVNFAHGSFYMLAAYLTYSLVGALPLGGASFYVGALLASLAVAGVGALVEVLLLRRVYRAPELYQLLLTFALVLVAADVVRFVWGADNKTGPEASGLRGSVRLLGQLVPTYDLAMLAFGPLVAVGLWLVFHRTRWGVLIRAATQDREMVSALGVDQSRLFTGVFALGSFLAGLAGALQVPRVALTTVMDTTVIVEAFVVVVIGGMGSVWGALLASLLIGVLNAFGILVFPKISIVLMFVVMAVVLVVRPWGLLGRPEVQARAPAAVAEGGAAPRPGWLALAVAALAAAPLALPSFWVGVLVEVLAFALFATSLHLLMGTSGMVSFGHAAYFGVGAYGAALLLKPLGWPMPAAYLAAPLLAATAALVFGYFCVRLTSIYFAMLTLAFAQIVYAVAQQWDAVTGGDNGVLGVWPPPWLGPSVSAGYYYWALVSAVVGIAALRYLTGSPFGLALRAARDHPRRAEAIGIDIRAHQLGAFVVAGLFAGLAGAIFVFLKGSVFPVYVETPMSVQPLVMVLLGGVGSAGGPALGAAVYKLLDTWITRYTDYWQVALGSILIVLVTAFPRGILGAVAGRRR